MAEAMMKHLPVQAGSPVSTQLREEVRTEQVKSRARYGFGEAVGRSLDTVAEGPFIPAPVSTLIRCVRDAVVSVARAVWDFSSELLIRYFSLSPVATATGLFIFTLYP